MSAPTSQRLPVPRGPLSERLLEALLGQPGEAELGIAVEPQADPLADEDLQLALYVAYELHYRGFDGVDERWEWDPALLGLRRRIEEPFEAAVRALTGDPPDGVAATDSDRALREIADADDGPSISGHLARHGTREQMLEFMVHRSPYQLKEADPQSLVIPRIEGRPKAAMVEILADEYGGGRAERIHAELFARAMDAVGLDRGQGAYLDLLPARTLATVNLLSLFGLHRRLRGCLVGHLALFEMTSSVPSRRYGDAMRRLGLGHASEFFDEHVEADAVHESIAGVDLAGGMMAEGPEMARDVLFGAMALVAVEGLWASELVEAWEAGRSSLLRPLGAALAV